MSTSKLWIFSN